MDDLYDRDEYEYRIGYQYKDGSVFFTEAIDERDVPERLTLWQTKNRFILLSDPWVERRRVLKWQRV
jgi:hypothetical protein